MNQIQNNSEMWLKDENGHWTYNMAWDGTTPPGGYSKPDLPPNTPLVSVFAHCQKCYCWHNTATACHTYGNYGNYTPTNYIYLPYEGFDAKKWPKTFMTLMMMYHMPDWSQNCKYVGGGFPAHIGGKYDKQE